MPDIALNIPTLCCPILWPVTIRTAVRWELNPQPEFSDVRQPNVMTFDDCVKFAERVGIKDQTPK